VVVTEPPSDRGELALWTRRFTKQQSVERDAECIEIGAIIAALPDQQLWRHVQWRADHAAATAERAPGNAKVDDFHVCGVVDQDVRRLEIEVDDASAVHVRKRAAHRHDVIDHDAPVAGLQRLVDRRAVDLFHGDGKVGAAAELLEVVHASNVRVIEPRHGAELGLKQREQRWILGETLRNLECDGAIGMERVTDVVHPSHTAVSDRATNRVPAVDHRALTHPTWHTQTALINTGFGAGLTGPGERLHQRVRGRQVAGGRWCLHGARTSSVGRTEKDCSECPDEVLIVSPIQKLARLAFVATWSSGLCPWDLSAR
jgi:hypothetical protein